MAKTFRYQHFYTSTAGRIPSASTLNDAEIALNIAAGQEKMFVKNSAGNVVEFIPKPQIDAKINALDKSASSETGKIVTTVTQVDGLVSETREYLKNIVLSGYSKDTTAQGAINDSDSVQTALSKLENKVGANKITNDDHSIVVTEPTGTATTTDIKVNIKSGENVIKLDNSSNGGLYTDIKLSAITPSSTNVKEEYALIASDGTTQLGTSIKVYKDSSLYRVYLGHVDDTLSNDEDPTSIVSGTGATALCFIYQLADGTYSLVPVDVSQFLEETEFADGLQVVDHVVSVKKDSTSEKVITVYNPTGNTESDVITVSSNGVKIANIQAAIDAKIGTLDVSDSAESGKYVSQVSETDGKISVSRANVSEAVLNNYSKGSDATAVAASDTVNQAISKLENQVDKAKAAATTKVEKDTNAAHLTLTSTTNADNSVTYTIGETDIASASALTELRTDATNSANTLNTAIQTEVTRAQSAETILRREIDEEVSARTNSDRALSDEIDAIELGAGLTSAGTYTANTSANYISGATSLADADNKLDATLYQLSGAVQSAVSGLDFTDTAVTNQWVTKVDESNGVIAPTRSYISITNLTTDGTEDVQVAQNGDIILSAGTFDD